MVLKIVFDRKTEEDVFKHHPIGHCGFFFEHFTIHIPFVRSLVRPSSSSSPLSHTVERQLNQPNTLKLLRRTQLDCWQLLCYAIPPAISSTPTDFRTEPEPNRTVSDWVSEWMGMNEWPTIKINHKRSTGSNQPSITAITKWWRKNTTHFSIEDNMFFWLLLRGTKVGTQKKQKKCLNFDAMAEKKLKLMTCGIFLF